MTATHVLLISDDAALAERLAAWLVTDEATFTVEHGVEPSVLPCVVSAFDVCLCVEAVAAVDDYALLRRGILPWPVLVLAAEERADADLAACAAGAAGYLGLDDLTPMRLQRAVRYAAATVRGAAQRVVEERLRDSEQRLQMAVDAASLGLWDWDIARQRFYYSPQWKAQLGYADHELVSGPTLWESLLHPDDLSRCAERLRDFIRSPSGFYNDEFRLRHRDGRYRWIHSRAAFLRNAAGRATRMIGMHVDLTERREAEDAVRRLNGELEQRVVDRTAQLEAANRELEAFSYSVSHDLRAPLRSIDGFARALQDEHHDALPAQALHYLDRVRGAAQRMSGLIDDLLALARVSRSTMKRIAVDLSATAGEIAAELARNEPHRRVQMSISPGLTARGDPLLLRLALENLIGNAWKYTGKCASAHVAVGSESQGGERVFFVRDDGAGFDPAYADKLFGPFQRLHPSHEFEGTGIGLATVQRIIHRHGGRIWAEGRVGRGATFYFTLTPRRRPAVALAAARAG